MAYQDSELCVTVDILSLCLFSAYHNWDEMSIMCH